MTEVQHPRMAGGCLCRRVRYRIGGAPVYVAVCHCTNCQRQTGAPFAMSVAVPRDLVAVEGETRTFHDTGDSGAAVHRVFCPNCSSPILANPDLKPDMSFVFASTLDDARSFRPTMQIYCDSAQPWIALDGLRSFAKMPG